MNSESRLHSAPLNSLVDPSGVRVLRALDPIARSTNANTSERSNGAWPIHVNFHGLRPIGVQTAFICEVRTSQLRARILLYMNDFK
jgi:uncharacterized membrane protein